MESEAHRQFALLSRRPKVSLTTEYNTEQVYPDFSNVLSILIMANEELQIHC